MDLPSRSESYKKNEIKTFPPCFSIFSSHHTDRLRTHCALCLGEDDDTIYIEIIVAMGVGDATTPIAYEDHSSNGPMR
jgi:hypothetical protein